MVEVVFYTHAKDKEMIRVLNIFHRQKIMLKSIYKLGFSSFTNKPTRFNREKGHLIKELPCPYI